MEKNTHKFWTRLEVLQRTPNELQIVAPDADSGRYVTAWTLGATESLKKYQDAEVFLGGLVTKDFLPAEFLAAYGGNPMSANLFLQVTGMKMWP